MPFKDKLEKVCEKCTDATKKVYLQNIKRLYRFFDPEGEVPMSGTWLNSDKVLKQYKALPFSKRRALSVGAVKAARAYKMNSDAWYKRLVDDQDKYRANRNQNKRSSEEAQKMLKGGVKELKKMASEYKRQINRELGTTPTLKGLYKYQLYLAMRLFVELPFRNDFPTFRVSGQDGNYIIYKKKKKATFVVTEYKNSDRLGPRKVEITAALTRALKTFLKYRAPLVTHEFLFSGAKGKPMTKPSFSKAFHKITLDRSGKSFGSRILRIMHATENADIIEKSSELTNKMLHTASQTKQYIKK